jgi:6,7-dimethyl-8-ribityllumazine synthase
MATRVIEGGLVVPKGAKFAIGASRFNHFIVDRLVEGAVDALVRHGAQPEDVTIVRVPGAWEPPLMARRLAGTGKLSAIVALGAVIRGATPHFDYVAGEAAGGLAAAAHASAVPIVTAIEMVALAHALDEAGL